MVDLEVSGQKPAARDDTRCIIYGIEIMLTQRAGVYRIKLHRVHFW